MANCNTLLQRRVVCDYEGEEEKGKEEAKIGEDIIDDGIGQVNLACVALDQDLQAKYLGVDLKAVLNLLHAPAVFQSAVPILPPSPPQSRHKLKRMRRSRSRVTDSSSEDEDEYDVPALEPGKGEEGQLSQDGAVAIGYNKWKMSSHSPEGSAQDCVEDEF
ncbi:hypothetical protein C8Q74DRAFT_1363489 [Fomes fomentarius]|nr:hypothetical protein C8Q74DRAFT_1363489 [Fomes fomentarius]